MYHSSHLHITVLGHQHSQLCGTTYHLGDLQESGSDPALILAAGHQHSNLRILPETTGLALEEPGDFPLDLEMIGGKDPHNARLVNVKDLG